MAIETVPKLRWNGQLTVWHRYDTDDAVIDGDIYRVELRGQLTQPVTVTADIGGGQWQTWTLEPGRVRRRATPPAGTTRIGWLIREA